MKLKTATLIAIIGQILAQIYWQCFSAFQLYRVLGEKGASEISLLVAVVGPGSLVLFLAVLYSKQK